jgi:16S rRNA (cytidine1402-2'-O)-methyltransferase
MTEQIEGGALYVVSTPIGNLGDITHRAAHVLAGVDLIAAEDTRTTRVLLDHLGIRTPLVSYHSHNEDRRARELIRRLREGRSVAVVTDAGTPGVSDPAHAVIAEAVANGVRVIPVPGASALLAALVAGGLPMDRFTFEGFLPVKKGRSTRLNALAAETRTIVLYESPHRVVRTVRDLLEKLGDRPAAVARELTKKFEEVIRGPLSGVLKQLERREPRGEYVVMVAGTGYRQPADQQITTESDDQNGDES